MSDLKTLGPYQILEQLGVGGMAVVYKAFHPAMQRFVAIKMLARHMAGDPNFLARFKREAQVIARLEHRHILPVHDIGEDQGIPYLVMRYTDAGTMSDLLERGPLPMERAVDLVAQVGEALAYAHRQGIIHRDIKPANVLLSREGDALLSDFGIAKIVEEGLGLTGDGALLGTPFYMAPEQVQGRPADPRSDLYALGVVLYETLTGRRPFVAETPMAVALMHVHSALPPPRTLNPNLPDFLEHILLKALAKDPNHRFQSGAELVAALREAQALLRSGSSTAHPVAAQHRAETAAHDGAAQRAGSWPGAAGDMAPSAPGSWPGSAGSQQLDQRAGSWTGANAVQQQGAVGGGATGATPTPGGSRRRPLAVAAIAGVLGIALLVALVVRPWQGSGTTGGAGGRRNSQGSFTFPAGPTVTPRQGVRVFANTRNIRDLLMLGDTVWVATDGGLVRIGPDGAIRAFTLADGFSHTGATALLRGPDDTLWVGHNGGISQVRLVADGLGDIRYFTYEDGISGEIGDLMVDSDGSIVAVSSWGTAIMRFDGKSWGPMNLPLDAPELEGVRLNIVSVLRSSDGALWLGLDEAGLLRWKDNSWHHFTTEEGLGQGYIGELLEDRRGTIWVALQDQGLLQFQPGEGRFTRVAVGEEPAPIRWVGESTTGLLLAVSEQFVAHSSDGGATWAQSSTANLEAAGFGAIVDDGAGRLWMATNNGVAHYDGAAWTLLRREGEPTSFRFQELSQAPGGNLAAVPLYGGPVTLIDTATGTMSQLDHPEVQNQQIFSAIVGEDTIWLGTGGGLLRVRGDTIRPFTVEDGLPDNQINLLLRTDKHIWIGTERGLVAYDRQADVLGEPVPEFDDAPIFTMHAAADGKVWVGTGRAYDGNGERSGPVRLGSFDGERWTIYASGTEPIGADGDAVSKIGSDADGKLWVFVSNHGLLSQEGDRWRVWSQDDGAPPSYVLGMTLKGEHLWMGGLLRNTLYRWSRDGWRSFSLDTLSGDVFAMQFTKDGALWLGTGDGLIRLEEPK